MFCEEIRTKQDLSYTSVCSLRILYNSKYILLATSLGTNTVVVKRVHCSILNCILWAKYKVPGPALEISRHSFSVQIRKKVDFKD